MTILVLDGHENQAVACVRSLAHAGHRVIVGAETSWSKAGWSRACSGSFTYADPRLDAQAFVSAVAARAADERGALVLPMTEQTTLPLSRERGVIGWSGGRLLLPPHETVVRAFDKHETTKLARSLGIVVPWTLELSSAADAREHAAALPYPVVLKPKSSQEFTGGTVRTTGAPRYARNADEFLRAWHDVAGRCRLLLVQEFVEGAGVGYFALMRRGELRAEFAHRRLRDVKPTGSGSSLRISTTIDPRVRSAALSVLSALEWHGVAMVEFRVRRDGTPVFLEVNGRFWNSLALAVHAGVDFPALAVKLVGNGDVARQKGYRLGVRCRWFLGDVRHLLEVWAGAPAGYPGRFPGRLSTLGRFVMPVRGTYHDNFSRRDPLPELGDWLHFTFHKLRGRRAGSLAHFWHAKRRPSHP